MSIGLLFWVIMLIQLLFGVWVNRSSAYSIGGTVVLWVLLALLGWKVFGPAIHS